jgi:hypothetical protein
MNREAFLDLKVATDPGSSTQFSTPFSESIGRVYKNHDPRGRIIERIAEEVFEATGRNTLLNIAVELERIALMDDYFVTRKTLS